MVKQEDPQNTQWEVKQVADTSGAAR